MTQEIGVLLVAFWLTTWQTLPTSLHLQCISLSFYCVIYLTPGCSVKHSRIYEFIFFHNMLKTRELAKLFCRWRLLSSVSVPHVVVTQYYYFTHPKKKKNVKNIFLLSQFTSCAQLHCDCNINQDLSLLKSISDILHRWCSVIYLRWQVWTLTCEQWTLAIWRRFYTQLALPSTQKQAARLWMPAVEV